MGFDQFSAIFFAIVHYAVIENKIGLLVGFHELRFGTNHWSRARFVSGHAQHALHFGFSAGTGADDVMTVLTSLEPLATELPII